MAIKLATAWIKNSVRFMILFHKDEGNGCTGTKCKSNEESLKEFAHPRVEVVIHQISDGISHSDSRNEGHDTACDNEIGIGRKTTIARPDMGEIPEAEAPEFPGFPELLCSRYWFSCCSLIRSCLPTLEEYNSPRLISSYTVVFLI